MSNSTNEEFFNTATYWLLDGRSRAYDVKEELKAQGAKWDRHHKHWFITGPSPEKITFLKNLGLKLQWRTS